MNRPARSGLVSSSPAPESLSLSRAGDHFVGRFTAMASPCEVLVDTDDHAEAWDALHAASDEARRIEFKFSRYRKDNVVHRINSADGGPVAVDDETRLLLDYAAACHESSDGRFDITSGVLRRVWRFDGRTAAPSADAVTDVLRHVGWSRASWADGVLQMPAGMEIDLGGLGKEYAVDRAALLAMRRTSAALLVNFGGDLLATAPRRGERPWSVGVDDPERTGEAAVYRVDLSAGALATSGDARRWVTHDGRRLGHILDPRTGWPVEGAPRSVTVLARTCLEAGTLSTLAMLEGGGAEEFLRAMGVEHRVVR